MSTHGPLRNVACAVRCCHLVEVAGIFPAPTLSVEAEEQLVRGTKVIKATQVKHNGREKVCREGGR